MKMTMNRVNQIQAEKLVKKAGVEFSTICTMGYTHGVSSLNENRAAHGAVKMCQVAILADKTIIGRYVLSNGRHEEIGEPFFMEMNQLKDWEKLGACER